MVPGSSVNARVPTDDDAIIVPTDDAAITPAVAPPMALSSAPHESSTEEAETDDRSRSLVQVHWKPALLVLEKGTTT